MHLSKDMDTLGRRLEGSARGIIKILKPDPSQPNRRRLEVIGNFRETPPLGITMRDGGCDFDLNPPKEPARNSGGRPSEARDAAIAFINEKLSVSDMETRELVKEWKAKGEAEVTFFSARKKMIEDGLVVIDDSGKRQMCHLIKP